MVTNLSYGFLSLYFHLSFVSHPCVISPVGDNLVHFGVVCMGFQCSLGVLQKHTNNKNLQFFYCLNTSTSPYVVKEGTLLNKRTTPSPIFVQIISIQSCCKPLVLNLCGGVK